VDPSLILVRLSRIIWLFDTLLQRTWDTVVRNSSILVSMTFAGCMQ
jgi:hypothetical protein